MKKEDSVVLFNQKQVRRCWDEEKELWYFSVVDVIEVLADTARPRKYWNDLKKKLSEEGSELSGKIGQLKMLTQTFSSAPAGSRHPSDRQSCISGFLPISLN